jgi:integrase
VHRIVGGPDGATVRQPRYGNCPRVGAPEAWWRTSTFAAFAIGIIRATAGASPRETSKPRKADLDGLRIHDLRHTAVAMWIAAGAGPKEVATRAGHTSVSFTLDRYGHLYPEADTALRDYLDALRGRRPGRARHRDRAAP